MTDPTIEEVKKQAGIRTALPIVAIAIAVFGVGSGLLYQRHVASVHAAVLERAAEINSRLPIRSMRVDENGIEHHTLCSGGGWCVTDRVPPNDWNAPQQKEQRLGHGVPVVDVAALCASAKGPASTEVSALCLK